MFEGLTQLANLSVQQTLSLYYETASHRLALPSIPLATTAEPRPLYFFRGMLHFEPAKPFLDTLANSGYSTHVFRFAQEAEQNNLRQWRENTVDVIRYFIEREELLKPKPVFVGHSAGGLTAFVLGAMAKGASLIELQSALPGLETIPQEDLRRLSRALKGSRFITVASPLNGIQLTIPGKIINRTVVHPREPLLLTGITRRNLRNFYKAIGAEPEQVIDGTIVSYHDYLNLEGGIASLASSAIVHGALRVCSPFLRHSFLNDGIVPLKSALLSGPEQVFLKLDHLRLVETAEAGQALAELIRRVQLTASNS